MHFPKTLAAAAMALLLVLPLCGCGDMVAGIAQKKFNVSDGDLKDGGTVYKNAIKHIKGFCEDVAGNRQSSDSGGSAFATTDSQFVSYQSAFDTTTAVPYYDIKVVAKQPSNANRCKCLFFTGKFCEPCKAIKDDFDNRLKPQGWKLGTDETSDDILLIDADDNPRWAQKFGITTAPTFVIVTPQGKELKRHVGSLPNNDATILTTWIDSVRKWHEKNTATERTQIIAVPSGQKFADVYPTNLPMATPVVNQVAPGLLQKAESYQTAYRGGCACGCNGNCGGNCGCAGCTCRRYSTPLSGVYPGYRGMRSGGCASCGSGGGGFMEGGPARRTLKRIGGFFLHPFSGLRGRCHGGGCC